MKGENMSEKELKAIQSDIKRKGYKWNPGVTSVSERGVNEQKALLGLSVDKAELDAMSQAIEAAEKVEEKLTAFQALPTAPASVDWRNKGGNWTTPIRDQKSCGSCVSFGVVATLESRINIACKNPNLDKELSEAHLFYCGCGNCCGTGWNFSPALDFCKNTGVGLETSFPYTPGNQPCKSGISPYVKISSWKSLLTVADRKNILATKGPVVAGMAVYSDFFSYRSGIYRRTPAATLRGYHAISVVGYDENEKCWICKNSWGTSWGDNGWFKIGFGECLIDTSFAFYDMDVKCPDVCGRYRKLALVRMVYYRRTRKLQYLCTYHRYMASYYLCRYRATKNRCYLCLYYRHLASYYLCRYRATKNRRYLCAYYRYKAAYYACMYRSTRNRDYLRYYKRYYAAYKRCRANNQLT
jgi:C1A family cysteine protease